MKKAFAWLEGNGIDYRLHDYNKSGISEDKIESWIALVGWEALLNTKGTTFRKLPPARQEGLNAHKAASLMKELPSAIKRPVIESGRELLIGFDPERYARVLHK